VNHTSDQDISAALDAAIAKEKKKRLLKCDPSWPSPRDKGMLVKHIGGSYIFMTTIIKLLFDPQSNDGLTPVDRLPLVLGTSPDFDGLYKTILAPSAQLPHFRSVLSAIALAGEPLSISQIADLLELKTRNVVNVLTNLHAVVQVPGDDRTPVTLWHTSLRDFLCCEKRSGPFYAAPIYHLRLLCGPPSLALDDDLWARYSILFSKEHLMGAVGSTDPIASICDGNLRESATAKLDKTILSV
jgi:hypothetical protein